MRLTLSYFIILILVMTMGCQTRPGVQDLKNSSGKSGSADPVARLRMSAWFLNSDREIHICFANKQESSLSEQVAFALIQKSFEPWAKILERVDHPIGLKAISGEYQFSTKLALKSTPDCSHADLILYFGSPPVNLSSDFPGAIVNTFGAARKIRTPIVSESVPLWQPGYLWVAGPEHSPYRTNKTDQFPTWIQWTDQLEAEVVLIQHWGFVLGNPEISDSPLDERVVATTLDNLRKAALTPENKRAIVDSYRQSIETMNFYSVADPEDDFGEHHSACDTGDDPLLELFVRAVPRGKVPCYFFRK